MGDEKEPGHDETEDASAVEPTAAAGNFGADLPTEDDRASSELGHEPRQIGPYRLHERIGEGGMGEVYLAEQTRPVRRRVALKLIRHGMDSRQVVARFESERQALALMDHPGIAKVLDAGTSSRGRPYFVMEYVKGIPITAHCDTHRLGLTERLELFVQVCEAIQHAHHNAIIHRDIKPSNVLVAIQDDRPVPKVIDFGVAKAVSTRLTDHTLHTRLGQLIGTPEYMSPEQAEMTGQDVDTRTDVYSLGMILYELLAGGLPFDPKELRSSGLPEIQRRIRDEDPPRPSARVRSDPALSTASAERRRTDPQKLVGQLRGELDWITMKALEKDRTRRYGSPMELAEDIRRYLRNEPVLAMPPSTAYKVTKFVRRHRLGVTFFGTVMVLLVGFAVVMSVQAARIAGERDRAEREARKASAFNRFVEETLLSPDPVARLGREVTVAEALDEALAKLRETTDGEPEVEAAILHAIGTAYLKLGDYDKADPLVREALAIRRRVLGDENLEVADSLLRLGELEANRGDFDAAEAAYRESLRLRRELAGGDDVSVVPPLQLLGGLLTDSGRYDEAEQTLRDALEVLEEGDGHELEIATVLNRLGTVAYRRADDPAAAEQPLREALRIRRAVLGDEHVLVAESVNNLAVMLDGMGDRTAAEAMYRESLALHRKLLGEEHESVAAIMGNLALLLEDGGDPKEVEELYRGALEIDRRQLGVDHPFIAYDLSNLGIFLTRRGRADEALPLHEESVRLLVGALEPDDWQIGNARHLYGFCLAQLGRYEEAESQLIEAVGLLDAGLGAENWRTVTARSRLIDVYEELGKPVQADEQRAWLPEGWERLLRR